MSSQKREKLLSAAAIICLIAVVAVVWAWEINPEPIDPPTPIIHTLVLDTLKRRCRKRRIFVRENR